MEAEARPPLAVSLVALVPPLVAVAAALAVLGPGWPAASYPEVSARLAASSAGSSTVGPERTRRGRRRKWCDGSTDYWPEWSNFFGRWDTYIPQMDTWLFSIQGHIERMRFINEKYLPIIASNTAAINVSINQNITGNAEGFGSIREANRELVEGIKEAFRSNTAGLRTEILAARP